MSPETGPKLALGTFTAGEEPFAALVLGERAFELAPRLERPGVTLHALLQEWDEALARLRELAERLADADGDHELGSLRALPPVDARGQVFQAAANYRQHVLDLMAGAERRGDDSDGLSSAERDAAAASLDERAARGRPFVFLGSAHAMVGANDDVILPQGSDQSDWELELAAVIGRHGRRVAPAEAMSLVAGYTICNDLTSRDALARWDSHELGLDWLAGKNSPTFLPTGPLLVPASEVPDPMDLRLRLDVNGRTMQDETTADMLFDVASLICHISAIAELRPGDLVLTGSPAGNGASHGIFLQPGDLMEASITGLGSQRNRCVAASEVVA
jgi:2-keto-4-pentenoate hydratase/2-oxohepta-3-ene-1,7-dioic acid hydratase in catechol pathway